MQMHGASIEMGGCKTAWMTFANEMRNKRYGNKRRGKSTRVKRFNANLREAQLLRWSRVLAELKSLRWNAYKNFKTPFDRFQ